MPRSWRRSFCATKVFSWSRSGRQRCLRARRGCASPSLRSIPMPTSSGSRTWCGCACKGAKTLTAIFITATGTDIGKTFVAASLIGHFRQMGRLVDAIKPVVSGFDPAAAAASDSGILLDALGLPVTAAEIDRISPWRFRAALSPDLAAARAGRSIDVDAVVAFCQTAVDARRDIL